EFRRVLFRSIPIRRASFSVSPDRAKSAIAVFFGMVQALVGRSRNCTALGSGTGSLYQSGAEEQDLFSSKVSPEATPGRKPQVIQELFERWETRDQMDR